MMKSTHTLGTAFFLNAAFSLVELTGGIITGSTAILSDAVHDFGDALGIGLSCWFEKRSKHQADEQYTFGYARYTILGGVLSALMLVFGSVVMIVHAIGRLQNPVELQYSGMMAVAIVGVFVNVAAARLVHRGETLNEKAVFWHLLEDVLGWVVVLIGAVVMRLTDWVWIDPLLSIGVATFVAIHAVGHLREGIPIFLEKAPSAVSAKELLARIEAVDGVERIEKLYLWSLDDTQHCAALQLQISGEEEIVKGDVRAVLEEYGIVKEVIETQIAENVQDAAFSVYF